MADRPSITASRLAALAGEAPARLIRKLDASPRLADGWTWGSGKVMTESGEAVSLDATDGVVAAMSCSCLLSPRCLHVLAVAHVLPIADESTPAPDVKGASEMSETGALVSSDQQDAARALWRAGIALLWEGACAAGAIRQADVLRAAHTCRALSLHRAAAAGVRVVRGVKDLREERPEASLPALEADVLELLETASLLAASAGKTVPTSLLGVARRSFEPAGSLRLFGLFTEAVVTSSGYAGVSTMLCDAESRLFTLSDVKPGDPERARSAYRGGATIGDVSLSFEALCREGLFVQDATSSMDGRLGTGSAVRAVRSGPSRWTDGPPSALFRQSLKEQVDRAFGALDRPPSERAAGADVVFAEVTVKGPAKEALIVRDAAMEIGLVSASDHAELHTRENLALLSRRPGLTFRVAARLVPHRPRTLAILALGQAPAEERLRLPAEWGGRCNAAFDRLQGSYIDGSGSALVEDEHAGPPSDPLAAVHRRLLAVVSAGRLALPTASLTEVDREAHRLGANLMPAAAVRIHQLALAAHGGPERLAHAWLSAAVYERRARTSLERAAWLAG